VFKGREGDLAAADAVSDPPSGRDIMLAVEVVMGNWKTETNEEYWSYLAPRPPRVDELPAGTFTGTQDDWQKLSPGMRREIARQAEKKIVK